MKEKKPPKMMPHARKALSVSKNSGADGEDVALWRTVTQDVTKWQESNKVGRYEDPRQKPITPKTSKNKSNFVPVMTGQITLDSFAAITHTDSQSSYQVDAAMEKRFIRGELPMDGTIDLHGMTLAQAHAQFMRFMTRKIQNGARCVLVITGKGSTDTENGRGVIRKNLPLWCEDKSLGLHILKINNASPRHGGSGAFYILLRRKRSSGG